MGLIFVGTVRTWNQHEANARGHKPSPAKAEQTTSEVAGTLSASKLRPAASIPHSLRSTEVDGNLTVNRQGHFVPTPDARRLFDYFLSATGEEPEAVLRARIVAEIKLRLMPPASDEAEALLDAYLAYRAAVRTLALGNDAPADLEQRLKRLRELQRTHLGSAAAEAFFSDDDTDVERAIERRRVAADANLPDAERARRLTELDAERPATAALAAAREVRALREAGGSEADVHALRSQRFGSEAATRLAALDQRRAEWAERLEAYRAERARLLAGSFPDDRARNAALDQLRQAHFSSAEKQRVAALDQMAGLE